MQSNNHHNNNHNTHKNTSSLDDNSDCDFNQTPNPTPVYEHEHSHYDCDDDSDANFFDIINVDKHSDISMASNVFVDIDDHSDIQAPCDLLIDIRPDQEDYDHDHCDYDDDISDVSSQSSPSVIISPNNLLDVSVLYNYPLNQPNIVDTRFITMTLTQIDISYNYFNYLFFTKRGNKYATFNSFCIKQIFNKVKHLIVFKLLSLLRKQVSQTSIHKRIMLHKELFSRFTGEQLARFDALNTVEILEAFKHNTNHRVLITVKLWSYILNAGVNVQFVFNLLDVPEPKDINNRFDVFMKK